MTYPSNSHKVTNGQIPKEKKTKQSQTPIVTGEVIQRKPSLGYRFKSIFFNGEFKTAIRYTLTEVMVPAARNMIVDATIASVERVIYGESRNTRPRRGVMPDVARTRFSYSQVSTKDPRARGSLPDQAPAYNVGRNSRDIGQIVFISREEAELVLERMHDIIDEYDVVSVADLHELTALPTAHTDNNYGWTSLGYAQVRQTRQGYLLDLPPAEKI